MLCIYEEEISSWKFKSTHPEINYKCNTYIYIYMIKISVSAKEDAKLTEQVLVIFLTSLTLLIQKIAIFNVSFCTRMVPETVQHGAHGSM